MPGVTTLPGGRIEARLVGPAEVNSDNPGVAYLDLSRTGSVLGCKKADTRREVLPVGDVG